MKQFSKRNAIIAIFIMIFVITGGILFIYILESRPKEWACKNEAWCVTIYGNVQANVSIGISMLRDNGTFVYVPDKQYEWLNSGGSSSTISFAGVSLADVFKQTKVLPSNATRLRFKALRDGYSSFELPLSVVLNNPDSVLLANRENGHVLGTKEQGDDGPIRSFVSLSILQGNSEVATIFYKNGQTSVYNSVYAVKYCDSIEII